MKPSFLLSSKAGVAFMVMCLSAIILVTSCSKKFDPQPEPVGDAKLRYVNSVQGSAAQDLYVNGTKKSTNAVAYGNVSPYLTVTSGSNTFGLYDAGATTANITTPAYGIPIGVNGTIFYRQLLSGPLDVFVIGDDMSAPATGKAKVRFINNNMYSGNNAISVAVVGQTTVLVPSLIYFDPQTSIAPYFSVDEGAKFKFAMSGVTDAPEFDGGIVAGKNYTIWIDGSSQTNLTGHVILQN